MAESKQLIRQRAVIKASITRINIFADAFDITKNGVHALHVKLRSVVELQRKYDTIQSELELSEDAVFDADSDRIQVEDDLCIIECKLHNLIEKFSTNLTENSNTTANDLSLIHI